MNRRRFPRSRRALAAALAGLALSATAHAEPLLTSWRSLDHIEYRVGCHDPEAAFQALETELAPSHPLWVDLLASGRCFVLPMPIEATLIEWVAGPYRVNSADSASIWRILDEAGETEYTFVPDLGGPHRPARSA